jgi:cobalt-zinc-cadmium efflux system outer membrane protein
MKQRFILAEKLFLSVLTAVVATNAAAADPATAVATNALTLPDAIRLALELSPELRAAGGRAAAAAGRANQSGLWPNPELEFSAEDWPVSSGRGFTDAKQTIGVAQTLPFPGKQSLDRRIGTAGTKLSDAELAVRRAEVVRDVKAAFCQVLAAERRVSVSAELVRVAESSAATARKRVDAGATPYQEQLRAEIQREQARTELASMEREVATARETLVALLGRPDLHAAPVSGSLREKATPALLERGPETWLTNHPSSAAARANLERASLAQRRARLEPYPDVKVGVAGGRIGATDESIIELRLSVPLPLLDRSKGRKQEATAAVTVAVAELAIVEQRLLREWRQASQRYRAAAGQVASYREQILPKADEALRLVQLGFEQGKFGFIDLLDTQRTTAEARLAFQQKLLELNVAEAEMEALTEAERKEAQ